MRVFIKSLNEKSWRSVLIGQTHPTITDENGNIVPKPKITWSINDDKLAFYNNKALHAIFNGIGETQIKLYPHVCLQKKHEIFFK